ncbi:hypothetical protein GCM10027423_52570 [Spirosoma arcticum]
MGVQLSHCFSDRPLMIIIYQMVGNAENAQSLDQLGLIFVKFVNHSSRYGNEQRKAKDQKAA